MEYTKKHQNLIAKFFKKVGMPEAAQTILTCPEYDNEIALAMRDASTRMNIPLSTPALLDAVRRYETRHCPIFKECTLSSCDGSIWCSIYNIGGSHGRTGQQYRHLGEHSNLVPVMGETGTSRKSAGPLSVSIFWLMTLHMCPHSPPRIHFTPSLLASAYILAFSLFCIS